jgi:hypothetical protein
MKFEKELYRARWWLLALIVILQITILAISPEEKTIGIGIKPVYLHVSLTWTGMILLLINAILGLVVLVSGREKFAGWQRSFLLSALWFYGIGFLISMYASWLNWGGIPFQEPRIQGAINVLVSAIAVWVLREIWNSPRIHGIFGWIPVAFMLMSGRSSRMVLHPDNPVVSSPLSIRLTFLMMFGLAIMLSIWFLWMQRRTVEITSPNT